MEKVRASLRHVSADAGEGMSGGRITFTTDDPISVHLAKNAVQMAREGKWSVDDGGKYLRAARRVTAASLRHKRAIERVEKAHSLSEVFDRSCELCDASGAADEGVANFTPRNMADMRTKLAFMVENDMGNGIDRLSIIVADIDALSTREG